MTIYEIAMQYRASLLRQERDSIYRLTFAYGESYSRLQQMLKEIIDQIAWARRVGAPVKPEWLIQQRRLERLTAEIDQELKRLNAIAYNEIVGVQSRAVRHAQSYAAALFTELQIERSFAGLPSLAFESLVGFLADGSPLRDLLDALAEETAQDIGDALMDSILAGIHPLDIAQRVRQSAGAGLTRLFTILRTESLRSFREGTRLGFEQAGIQQWRWVASFNQRVCPACLAMHGRVFPISEPFGTHPNCRCTMIPVWEGVPIPDAEQWLRAQGEDRQDLILGKERAALWRAGKIQLADFVKERDDPRWGKTRTVRPLKDLRDVV